MFECVTVDIEILTHLNCKRNKSSQFSTETNSYFQTLHALRPLLTSLLNLDKIKDSKKESFSWSVTLSENIYNLVHTVDNYFIAIRALPSLFRSTEGRSLRVHWTSALPSMMLRGWQPEWTRPLSLINSGVISWRLFLFNTSITSAAVFIDFSTCAALNWLNRRWSACME